MIHSNSSDSVHHVVKRKVLRKRKKEDKDKPKKFKEYQALLDDLKDFSEIEVTLRLQLVKRFKQHLTENVKKQITEIEHMSNKEALLKKRLIQNKKR